MFESLKSLFGLGTDKEKKTMLRRAIDASPELKRLQAKMDAIDKAASDRVKADPELLDMLKELDIDPDDIA